MTCDKVVSVCLWPVWRWWIPFIARPPICKLWYAEEALVSQLFIYKSDNIIHKILEGRAVQYVVFIESYQMCT